MTIQSNDYSKQRTNQTKNSPYICILLFLMKDMTTLSSAIIADTNKYYTAWRVKTLRYLEKAVAICNKGGYKTYLISPLSMEEAGPENISVLFWKICLPVVLSENVVLYMDVFFSLLLSEGIVGVSKHKYENTEGLMLTYSYSRVAQVHPIRQDDKISIYRQKDTMEGTIMYLSPKYFLPLIYRAIEESAFNSSMIESEKQWLEQLKKGPIDFLLQRRETGEYNTLIKFDKYPLTGVSAAMKILRNSIPLPIEFACNSVVTFKEEISKKLNKPEFRFINIRYPTGYWYISVCQVLVNGVLMAMAYNTLKYTTCGVAKDNTTSPAFTMMHLFFDAWLLERRGIARSDGIYALIREYRKNETTWEKEYKLVGTKDDWVKLYYISEFGDSTRDK